MRAMKRDSDAGVRHDTAARAAMDAVLKRLRLLAGRNHLLSRARDPWDLSLHTHALSRHSLALRCCILAPLSAPSSANRCLLTTLPLTLNQQTCSLLQEAPSAIRSTIEIPLYEHVSCLVSDQASRPRYIFRVSNVYYVPRSWVLA